MKTLLSSQIFGHDNDGPLGEEMSKENGQEWLGSPADALTRQKPAPLHTLPQGMHRRSSRNDGR
jgi:hypothetical protein